MRDTEVRAELDDFVARVFVSLPRVDQRAKGCLYLRGLMLDGRRKSMQLCNGPFRGLREKRLR